MRRIRVPQGEKPHYKRVRWQDVKAGFVLAADDGGMMIATGEFTRMYGNHFMHGYRPISNGDHDNVSRHCATVRDGYVWRRVAIGRAAMIQEYREMKALAKIRLMMEDAHLATLCVVGAAK